MDEQKYKMCISISVVPASFVILSGCLIYVQYRQRTGWKFECIHYRRANKLRTSQENLNDEGSSCVDTTQEELNAHEEIENIGPLINSTHLWKMWTYLLLQTIILRVVLLGIEM